MYTPAVMHWQLSCREFEYLVPVEFGRAGLGHCVTENYGISAMS